MDFSERIAALADRAKKIKASLTTEEATKTALVLPFLQALGYDIFNPLEVVPEYIADVAGRKGEKVDYAVMKEGKPILILECKAASANLNDTNREQLHRYFLTLTSCIGILTNGVRYLFFSTGEDGKNMDTVPFMDFNLEEVDANLLPELAKMRADKFDLQNTLDTVAELRFNRQVKLALAANLENPDPDFVDYFLGKAGIKGIRQKIRDERYQPYTKRAYVEFISEQVDSRLKTALAATASRAQEELPPAPPPQEAEYSEAEWQGYYLVKSMLMGIIESERVTLQPRAGVGRSGVCIDNRGKPLLILKFADPENMRIEVVTPLREREAHPIAKVDDILNYQDTIRATAHAYLNKTIGTPAAHQT